MQTIKDIGEALRKTRKFIWDVLPEPKDEFDVDEIAGLLIEGGYALCPKCACWCLAEELENDEQVCQECRDVAQLYRIGGML